MFIEVDFVPHAQRVAAQRAVLLAAIRVDRIPRSLHALHVQLYVLLRFVYANFQLRTPTTTLARVDVRFPLHVFHISYVRIFEFSATPYSVDQRMSVRRSRCIAKSMLKPTFIHSTPAQIINRKTRAHHLKLTQKRSGTK